MADLGDLRTRFEEDLATGMPISRTCDSVKRIEDNAVVAEERVSRVVAAQVALEEQVAAIRDEILAYQAALAGVEGVVEGQSGTLSEMISALMNCWVP